MPNSRKKRREAWLQLLEKRISEVYDKLVATGGYPRTGAGCPPGYVHKTATPEQQTLLDQMQELRKQKLQVAAEADKRPKKRVEAKHRPGSTFSRLKGQLCPGKKPKFTRAHSTNVAGSHKLPNPTSSRVSVVYHQGVAHVRIDYPASYFVTGNAPLARVTYHVDRDILTTTLPFRDQRQRQAYLDLCRKAAPKQPGPVWHPTKGDHPGRPVEVWQRAR